MAVLAPCPRPHDRPWAKLWDRIQQARRGLWPAPPVFVATRDPAKAVPDPAAPSPSQPEPSGFNLPDLYRLRAGDPEAQDRYVAAFWSEVEQEAAHYARRGGDREELRGEGALALWEAAFQYDPRRHRTGLDTYVRNAIHQRIRRAYRRQMGWDRPPALLREPRDAAAPAPGPADLETAEHRLDLARALGTLPAPQREVLGEYLAAVGPGGLGHEEAVRQVAECRGRSAAAVKKQVQRARRRLAELLRRT